MKLQGILNSWKSFLGKLWQSFAHNLPNGPLNVVWLFVVPSKCSNRALNGSSFWCKEQPIVWRFLFILFSKNVTSPPSQPVFAFVLSTRTALIVYQLHQYQEEPCESNIYSHLVSPLWLSSGIRSFGFFQNFTSIFLHWFLVVSCVFFLPSTPIQRRFSTFSLCFS